MKTKHSQVSTRMGNKSVLRAIEILDAFELGHAFQRTIEAVVPAVIGTMQESSLAAGFGDDGGGVMAADIVESAQGTVAAADDDDRLTGDHGAHKLAGRFHLFSAADELPGLAEYAEALKFRNAGIDVPGGRNGEACDRGARSS